MENVFAEEVSRPIANVAQRLQRLRTLGILSRQPVEAWPAAREDGESPSFLLLRALGTLVGGQGFAQLAVETPLAECGGAREQDQGNESDASNG